MTVVYEIASLRSQWREADIKAVSLRGVKRRGNLMDYVARRFIGKNKNAHKWACYNKGKRLDSRSRRE